MDLVARRAKKTLEGARAFGGVVLNERERLGCRSPLTESIPRIGHALDSRIGQFLRYGWLIDHLRCEGRDRRRCGGDRPGGHFSCCSSSQH